MDTAELGIVGLGRMGGNLALQALEKSIRVVGLSRGGVPEALRARGCVEAASAEDLRRELSPPRVVYLLVPAGEAVDEVVDALLDVLDEGDVIADGGNSYWGDSMRRHARCAARGVRFADVGTSGGLEGARHGACFMVGADDATEALLAPLLVPLAVPGGSVHAGPPGAGHFTKLVHNGIEFGMLQAIGEGVALLEAYGDPLPVADVLACWRHGSVIRSWLVDLMERGYRHEGGLEEIPSYVDDTGEVDWLVGDAIAMDVPAPVIATSVMELMASRDPRRTASRAIAVMRHGFGAHAFGPSPSAREERLHGRVGPPG